jgi:hypothetical protein
VTFSRRRPRERSQRWEREDSAERLANVVPSLRELKLELSEKRDDGVAVGNTSIRHVVVGSAAALFEFKCTGCNDASHDLTNQILSGLRRNLSRFEGTSRCLGNAGSRPCERNLVFVAHAVYAPEV